MKNMKPELSLLSFIYLVFMIWWSY